MAIRWPIVCFAKSHFTKRVKSYFVGFGDQICYQMFQDLRIPFSHLILFNILIVLSANCEVL